jgi:hypothetical protein
MVENRGLKDEDVKKPQPEPVKVDGGTSSAVHELDLEGEAEQVPKEAKAEKASEIRDQKPKP